MGSESVWGFPLKRQFESSFFFFFNNCTSVESGPNSEIVQAEASAGLPVLPPVDKSPWAPRRGRMSCPETALGAAHGLQTAG